MREETRDRILEGAVKVFSEKGYHRASMDEIASAAGVAKGTLYYNFPSKAELFCELVAEGYRMMVSEISKYLTDQMPCAEQLKNVIETNFRLFFTFSKLALILYGGLTAGIEEEARESILSTKEEYLRFVARIIERGMARGEFRNSDPELVAAGIIGAIEEVFARRATTGKTWTEEEIIGEMQHSVLNGILAR